MITTLSPAEDNPFDRFFRSKIFYAVIFQSRYGFCWQFVVGMN